MVLRLAGMGFLSSEGTEDERLQFTKQSLMPTELRFNSQPPVSEAPLDPSSAHEILFVP